MNDPFFASVDEVKPVFASKVLQSEEVPDLIAPGKGRDFFQNNNNFHEKNEPRKMRSGNHQKPSRSDPHRPLHKNNELKNNHHRYVENSRLPSMLNDVKAPPPLKIDPRKPPTSKILSFDNLPETWHLAQAYE